MSRDGVGEVERFKYLGPIIQNVGGFLGEYETQDEMWINEMERNVNLFYDK